MFERRSLARRAWVLPLIGAAVSFAGLFWKQVARGQAADAKSNPTAETLLRKTTDFFKNAKSLAVSWG
jgi:hypothetical protein